MSVSNNKKTSSIIENKMGAILTGFLLTFITSTIATIYNVEKTTEVFKTRLDYISVSISDLKKDISSLETELKAQMLTSWNQDRQNEYAKVIQEKFKHIDHRIEKIENKLTN